MISCCKARNALRRDNLGQDRIYSDYFCPCKHTVATESIKCGDKSSPCNHRALPTCLFHSRLHISRPSWTTHEQLVSLRVLNNVLMHLYSSQTSYCRRWQALTRDVRNLFSFVIHMGSMRLVVHFPWLMRPTIRINRTWVHFTIAPGNLSDSLCSVRLFNSEVSSSIHTDPNKRLNPSGFSLN